LGALLKAHQSELKAVAAAAANGDQQKTIDATSSLVVALVTGNPILGALAPLGRKGVARAFGCSVNAALTSALASLAEEDERRTFLNQIGDIVEVLLGQALIQLIRSQHAVKDEVLDALGGMRRDFESFRADFAAQLAAVPESVRVEEIVEVLDGGIGVRVSAATTTRVVLKQLVVRGTGSVGIDLT
jgi:hypothetical protein